MDEITPRHLLDLIVEIFECIEPKDPTDKISLKIKDEILYASFGDKRFTVIVKEISRLN